MWFLPHDMPLNIYTVLVLPVVPQSFRSTTSLKVLVSAYPKHSDIVVHGIIRMRKDPDKYLTPKGWVSSKNETELRPSSVKPPNLAELLSRLIVIH